MFCGHECLFYFKQHNAKRLSRYKLHPTQHAPDLLSQELTRERIYNPKSRFTIVRDAAKPQAGDERVKYLFQNHKEITQNFIAK